MKYTAPKLFISAAASDESQAGAPLPLAPSDEQLQQKFNEGREFEASRIAAQATLPASEAAAWVSPEQFDAHPDGGPDGSGRYLPMRKSMAGKFTMPLFTRAQPQADAAEPVAKWIDDPHDIEQGQMLNPAWLKLYGLTAEQAQAPGARRETSGTLGKEAS